MNGLPPPLSPLIATNPSSLTNPISYSPDIPTSIEPSPLLAQAQPQIASMHKPRSLSVSSSNVIHQQQPPHHDSYADFVKEEPGSPIESFDNLVSGGRTGTDVLLLDNSADPTDLSSSMIYPPNLDISSSSVVASTSMLSTYPHIDIAPSSSSSSLMNTYLQDPGTSGSPTHDQTNILNYTSNTSQTNTEETRINKQT